MTDNFSEKKIVIDCPPPYTSGILHIGHIYQYIPIEVLSRFLKQTDNKVILDFGFDIHGLPTELKARKLYKKVDFNLIKEFAEDNILKMVKDLKSLDFDIKKPWNTNELDYIDCVHQLLTKAYSKGLLSIKNRLTYFCSNCKTSLSKSEVSNRSVKKKGYFLKFRVGQEYYQAFTTKPELVFNSVAVFYNPEDKRYNCLKNKLAYIDKLNLVLPILQDTTVKSDFGTGLVYISAYGSFTDYQYIRKHNLNWKNYMNSKGIVQIPDIKFKNLDYQEFKNKYIKFLVSSDILKYYKDIDSIQIYHSERSSCNKSIHYINKPQVYILSSKIRKQILDKLDLITFQPEKYKSELKNWVLNLQDWCISRQNIFGTNFNLNIDYHNKIISKSQNLNSEVCDCWLDSSITWYYLYKKYKKIPKFRFQGYEIIRTWLLYSLISSEILGFSIPFEKVIFTSLLLNKSHKKISKSNSEISEVKNILKKYDKNTIRLWATKSFSDSDTIFQEVYLKNTYKQIQKLKSIFNFYYKNKIKFKDIPDLELEKQVQNIKSQWLNKIGNCQFRYYQDILQKFIKNYISKYSIPKFLKSNSYPCNFKKVLQEILFIFKPVIPNITQELQNLLKDI
jgi:valyl-tRNA synthetase